MGQKVHPHGARVGVIKNWDSRWYTDKKNVADYIIDDRNLEDITVEVFKVTSKIPSYNIDLNTIAKNDEN